MRGGSSLVDSPSQEVSWLRVTTDTESNVLNDKLVKDTTGHYSGPNTDTYSIGCADSCADYPTLSAAITACDAIPTQCYAITLTHKDVGG